jgi:hypothetical protein
MIRISIDWKGQKGLDNLIRYIENNVVYGEVQEQVRILGHHTADYMKETIVAERKNPARPDHKLENAITAETLDTTDGIEMGIGRISKLNTEAPYWEMINDGATYITKKTHVVPTTYFTDPGTGFVTFKEGSSHTIEGIDFVGKAIRNLDKELRIMIAKFGSKFIDGTQNASQGHAHGWGTGAGGAK